MKKVIYIFAVLVLAVSCYKDLSTQATTVIPDILISVDGVTSDTLTFAYGETIAFDPVVSQEGYSDDVFSYSWTIDLSANDNKSRVEISDEKAIEYKIANLPSNEPYFLELTVTNNETGFVQHKYWTLYITNSLGEGLLVAHTRDGGRTSDLDLLSATPVTYGYTSSEPRYTRNLYSLVNDSPIEGKVNGMLARTATDVSAANVSSFNENMIMLALNDHIVALDPINYMVKKQDADLFNGTPKNGFSASFLSNLASYSTVAVFGGVPYGSMDMLDNCYSKLAYPYEDAAVYSSANLACAESNQGFACGFDTNHHTFLYIIGVFLTQSAFSIMEGLSFPFDINSAVPVACGAFKGHEKSFLFIFNAGGSYYATIIDAEASTAESYELNAPEIENAVSFAVCDNSAIFYYATESKIYSTVFSAGVATTKPLSWKAGEGEKITGVQQYLQGWYGTNQFWKGVENSSENTEYPFPLSTHRLQIIITTYNESTGEGKIYLRPFNVSTGMFTFKDNGVYGGFGEITAITSTMR